MAEYLVAYPAGFGPVVEAGLRRRFRGNVTFSSDGMAAFTTNADARAVCALPGFQNVFHIIARAPSRGGVPMARAVLALVEGSRHLDGAVRAHCPRRFRFRVAFSDAGKLVSVPPEVRGRAESAIRRLGGTPDSQNPDFEFWFLRRREGTAFFALRLTRHGSDEKRLAPGSLSPAVCFWLCEWAGIRQGDTVLDPFAGSGAIPRMARGAFRCSCVIAGDRDAERVAQILWGMGSGGGRTSGGSGMRGNPGGIESDGNPGGSGMRGSPGGSGDDRNPGGSGDGGASGGRGGDRNPGDGRYPEGRGDDRTPGGSGSDRPPDGRGGGRGEDGKTRGADGAGGGPKQGANAPASPDSPGAFRGLQMDALHMPLEAGSVQRIITDPPWGEYAGISDMPGFLGQMLDSFARVLAADGTCVILTGAKSEMDAALAARARVWAKPTVLDVLIHGHKARAYRIAKRQGINGSVERGGREDGK